MQCCMARGGGLAQLASTAHKTQQISFRGGGLAQLASTTHKTRHISFRDGGLAQLASTTHKTRHISFRGRGLAQLASTTHKPQQISFTITQCSMEMGAASTTLINSTQNLTDQLECYVMLGGGGDCESDSS